MHQTKFDKAVIFLRKPLTIDSTNATILLTTTPVLILYRHSNEALSHLQKAQGVRKKTKIPYLIGKAMFTPKSEAKVIFALKEAHARTL